MGDLPVHFRKSPEAQVLYTFTDTITGTLFLSLYAAKDQTAGILNSNQVYSNTAETSAVMTGATPTKYLDIDFDVTITKPITTYGIMSVNVPMGNVGGAGGNDSNVYCIVKLRKVVGGVESEIASGTSTTFANNVSNSPAGTMMLVRFSVPQTTYNKDDVLRLTVEGWGSETAAGTTNIAIGHDPQNRAGLSILTGSNVTKLTAYLPLKVDL